MSSSWRADVADPDPADLAMLRWVAAGDSRGKELLRVELYSLAARGLVVLNAGPLPMLTPRGRLLLQVANGECAPPAD